MSKWNIFHKLNAETKISAGKAIADRIKTDLTSFLITKKTKESKEENHPQDLLNQAKGTIGKLSRIFEQMDWPIPEYEEISTQIKQVGLRAYTKSLLDNILPILLNATGTKLNQTVINAINSAGQGFIPPINDLYDKYHEHHSEEEIADQFAQAIIVSFTQKVLDTEKAKSETLMHTEIKQLTSQLETLSRNEDGEKLTQLKQAHEKNIRIQEEANLRRQLKLATDFNTPMEAMAKLTSAKGLQPTLDIENMEQAKEFIQAFDQLVGQLEVYTAEARITVPGLEKASIELNNARELINDVNGDFDELGEIGKVTKINQNLMAAANKIMDGISAQLEIRLPNPVENSLWQKFLNLFTTTKEMKIYNKQQVLLNKFTQDYKMQHEQVSSLEVDFKEDSIKVSGLGSDNAMAKFLSKLNADSDVTYHLDKEGNLSKVVDGQNENLSEKDIPQLKEQLKAMDSAPDSLYQIKQIEIEDNENERKMSL